MYLLQINRSPGEGAWLDEILYTIFITFIMFTVFIVFVMFTVAYRWTCCTTFDVVDLMTLVTYEAGY